MKFLTFVFGFFFFSRRQDENETIYVRKRRSDRIRHRLAMENGEEELISMIN